MPKTIKFDTVKTLIKAQPCFSSFTNKEVEILAGLLIEKHFRAGMTIVTEGDPVDCIYLIVEGKADVVHAFIKDDKIHHKHLATLGENEAIGLNETGFYSISGIRTATVIAKTDMTLLYLSVAAFHGFALTYSHVSEVMRTYAEKILDSK